MNDDATDGKYSGARDVPLCVELDGTLIKSDLFYESLFSLLKHKLWRVIFIPFWFLKGRGHLTARLAEHSDVDTSSIPLHEELVELLTEEKRQGRSLALISSSNVELSVAVADRLGCFDHIFASEPDRYLSTKTMRTLLTDEFGERGFDYIGGGRDSLRLWASSRRGIVVSSSKALASAASKRTTIDRVIEAPRNNLRAVIKELRIYQWLKNLLLFLPMLAAHRFLEIELVAQNVLAFISFGLCASSVYVLNDLIDLPSDRQHFRKRNRPFASGALTLDVGLMLAPSLLVLAFVLASLIRWQFATALAVYFSITLAYSLGLKRVPLLDVVVLATLFTTRVISGGHAVAVPISFWLLALSMFLFLSLALIKRYAELLDRKMRGQRMAHGRGYQVEDLGILGSLGAAAGYAAVLVLAFYVHSPDVSDLYSKPELLWMVCPALMLWISRLWLITGRGEMHDDPLFFALRDPASLLIIAAGGGFFLLAAWL